MKFISRKNLNYHMPENIFHSVDRICICPWTPSECHPGICLCMIAEESSDKQPQKQVQTHYRVCTEELVSCDQMNYFLYVPGKKTLMVRNRDKAFSLHSVCFALSE